MYNSGLAIGQKIKKVIMLKLSKNEKDKHILLELDLEEFRYKIFLQDYYEGAKEHFNILKNNIDKSIIGKRIIAFRYETESFIDVIQASNTEYFADDPEEMKSIDLIRTNVRVVIRTDDYYDYEFYFTYLNSHNCTCEIVDEIKKIYEEI